MEYVAAVREAQCRAIVTGDAVAVVTRDDREFFTVRETHWAQAPGWRLVTTIAAIPRSEPGRALADQVEEAPRRLPLTREGQSFERML